ncbi:Ankyrin-3-like protein [Cladobotryum mycophilum]|uniref:Ankyrin-3-like protein n=1 Tax=Cladobotryum mycophilum TaxID=491253 RepID=A0ABR0S8M7_9HYPO
MALEDTSSGLDQGRSSQITAGSGKSVLSSSVIKYLNEKHGNDPSIAIVYFYFSFSDTKKQERDGMLASLIKQICCCRPDTPESVKRLGRYKDKGMRPSAEELQEELIIATRGFSAVYIVIDALDECPELGGRRKELMKTVHDILTTAGDNLHLFCTSRKEPDIDTKLRPHLSGKARAGIDLSAHLLEIERDIRQYIDSTLTESKYKSWPDDTKGEVKEALVKKSDGMFQYVRCQFDELGKLKTPGEITQALENLPQGLDKTYQRMLQNIDPKYQIRVANALKWLSFSIRPLTLDELAEIFILQPGDNVIGDDIERLFDTEDVLTYFAGLIIVYEEEYSEDNKQYIRLAHFSIKEYLTSSRLQKDDALAFSFSETDAHLWIAYSCLSYHIYLSTLDSISDRERGYAPATTMLYCLARLPHLTELLLSRRFDTRKYLIQEDLNAVLWNAVYGGNVEIVSLLLDEGADANISLKPSGKIEFGDGKYGDTLQVAAFQGHTAIRGKWGSALQVAAGKRHLDVLKLLVGLGANINDPSNEAECVLSAAVRNYDCLQFLLDSEADVNLRGTGQWSQTALDKAARNAYWDQFDLLLEKGPHLDLGGKGSYPLHSLLGADRLTSGQALPRIKRLLDLGVDPNAQDGDSGTALHLACMRGNAQIARFLINNGADVNMTGEMHGTALQICASQGFTSLAELLLENEADPNIQGGFDGDALQAACAGKGIHLGMVQLLLDHGVDVNAQGGLYGSALGAAVHGLGHKSLNILRLLLDHGADVSAQVGPHKTALQIAAGGSNLDVVRLLLDHGADVNAQAEYHETALQNAAIGGNLDVMRLLLDHGADVNARAGLYETALHAAAMGGSLDAVRLLLDHGADVNVQADFPYGTALHIAASGSNLDVVRLLLDHGADASAHNRGWEDGTVLQVAVNKNNLDVVRLLLDHGADVNAQGGGSRTALRVAVIENNLDVVRLLLDHGADVNAQVGKLESPLQALRVSERTMGILRILIEHGANVQEPKDEYDSLWHYVAADSSQHATALLQLLLEHNANINQVDGKFGTALHLAFFPWNSKTEGKVTSKSSSKIKHGLMSRIQFLLESGAGVDVRGGRYSFALQAACAFGHEVVESRMKTDIAFLEISFEAVKFLLHKCPGIDINARGGIFGTALQAAAYAGNTELVRLLLSQETHIICNEHCGKYRTALNAAAIRGYWHIVDILLEAGAKSDVHLLIEPDEEWIAKIREENGASAEARYRKFWEVEKSEYEQALFARGRHVAYYYFIRVWILVRFQLLFNFLATIFGRWMKR